ncbi:ATP-dependent DNA ligase [Leifsonia sp. F6_8S_P_1B]|uniref:ATP-dependent DNA ligase n=1 Tax=Leifsonia williamsii TaxID=3035919 RepID=A0ABT8KDQ2_9MICO|nr:ATP-dependent DNA ligase [Leifsonia williamsii]MDN4615312.1 ATP-dependent DNA ligase [Leifsonia williamsii]
MGYLMYDSTTRIDFEDRVLAHIEVAIISKLRRRESFALSWRESSDGGNGRSTVWMDVSIPLRFRYEGSRPPKLDRDWVERLLSSASSSSGLLVTDEDGEPAPGHTHEKLL